MSKSDYVESRTHHAALFICALIIIGLLLIILFSPKAGVPAAREAKAVEVLQDAERLIRSTTQYGGDLEFDEECDTILDDIRDALAWLEEP